MPNSALSRNQRPPMTFIVASWFPTLTPLISRAEGCDHVRTAPSFPDLLAGSILAPRSPNPPPGVRLAAISSHLVSVTMLPSARTAEISAIAAEPTPSLVCSSDGRSEMPTYSSVRFDSSPASSCAAVNGTPMRHHSSGASGSSASLNPTSSQGNRSIAARVIERGIIVPIVNE